jgi:diacylglycerol kinase (ATP)
MVNIHKHIHSYGYALEGIHYALSKDQNLRIHFIAAILVIIFSIFFDVNPFEMGILGVMIVLVIVAEMVNTAIEQMVDLITNEHRKEAKIAKDVAAGMVLVTVIGSVIVGVLIFAPYLLRYLNIVV